MLRIITNLIDNVFHHTTKKSAVLEEIVNTSSTLEDETIPSLEEFLEMIKDVELSKDVEKELEGIFKLTGSKQKKLFPYVKELLKFTEELVIGLNMLENVAKVELPDVITDKTTTAKTGAILGTMNNITSVAFFIPDLILLIVYSVNNDKLLYSKKSDEIRKGGYAFGAIVKEYRGNMKKVIGKIPHLSDTIIDENASITVSANDKKFPLPNNGFIGNPIYHFRLWLVDREIAKYEILKDKRELTKLKIADIKTRQMNEPNPNLQKQIEYYENKLSKIEYEISEIEGDDDE